MLENFKLQSGAFWSVFVSAIGRQWTKSFDTDYQHQHSQTDTEW